MLLEINGSYARGGKGAGKVFSFTQMIEFQGDTSSDQLEIKVRDFATKFMKPASTEMVCYELTVSDARMPKPTKKNRMLAATYQCNIPGTRTATGGAKLCSLDTVLYLKTNARPGKPGSIMLRGAIFTNELADNGRGGFDLVQTAGADPAWYTTWETEVKAVDAGGLKFKLPPGKSGGTAVREVVSVAKGGVGRVKLTRKKTSALDKKRRAARQDMNRLKRDYLAAQVDDDGNPRTLDPEEKNLFAARAKDIADSYGGVNRLAEFKIPKEIKGLFTTTLVKTTG